MVVLSVRMLYVVCMPQFTMRMSDGEYAQLQRMADQGGISMTRFVKNRLGLLVDEAQDVADERLVDFERRLSRLEEMAGL